MTKPVYIINGFLESGKTEFITFTLGQPYFQIKGKTLLILCEEGENEYDPALLKKSRTDVVLIEEEEEFTPNHLIELEKQYKPARIIIEYNGMWNCKNMTLPWYWKVEQQNTTIDDLNVYKRNIKAVNPSADVIFEDSNGEIDEIFEEDLPYDLNQDPIVLDNQGYGIWYLDSMDHLERYEGKNIQFLAMVLKPEEYPDGYFVPGRMAMTCCAEDMAFLGYACEFAGTKDLKQKEWVKVTAKVAREYFADYKGEGPVLHAISVEKAKAPKDPVISFN